jgi:hypothetical protein
MPCPHLRGGGPRLNHFRMFQNGTVAACALTHGLDVDHDNFWTTQKAKARRVAAFRTDLGRIDQGLILASNCLRWRRVAAMSSQRAKRR